MSLGPAVGDLLSEPKLVSNGTNLSKVFIILVTLSKNDESTNVVDWGGERELVATELPLHYQYVERSATTLQLN